MALDWVQKEKKEMTVTELLEKLCGDLVIDGARGSVIAQRVARVGMLALSADFWRQVPRVRDE